VRAANSVNDKVRPLPREKKKKCCGKRDSQENRGLDKEEEKKVKEIKRKQSKDEASARIQVRAPQGVWHAVFTKQFSGVF